MTAVYVFDTWLLNLRNLGIRVSYQCHDEWLTNVREKDKQFLLRLVEQAIEQVNNKLKLNVKIGCSVAFGPNYAEVH